MQAIQLYRLVLNFQLAALAIIAPIASAQDVVTTRLGGVPVSKEPDHHLIFNNDFANVYFVKVPPQGATLLHQHLHDNIFVVFGDADVTNAVEGKTPVHLVLSNSSVNFGRAPYAHVVTNNSTAPFINLLIEFIQPQGEQKNFYNSVAAAIAAATPDAGGIEQNTILETRAVRVVGLSIPPNGAWPPPRDGQARLLILLDEITKRSQTPEANTGSVAEMLVWSNPNDETDAITNDSPQPMTVMVVEFKQSPNPPAAGL